LLTRFENASEAVAWGFPDSHLDTQHLGEDDRLGRSEVERSTDVTDTREGRARYEDAYRQMAKRARYRPAAPSDGF
jgi:hypothetical protein